MADTITIPSPSVFLRASPPPPPPSEDAAASASKNAPRPSSVEAKKKAPRKSSGGASAPATGDGGVVKPKQSKSRNGCLTCKAKRLKCGEEKPGCQQCAKRNVECGGYKKDFKWRPFEETNVKLNIDRQHLQQQKRLSPPQPLSGESSKNASPSVELVNPLASHQVLQVQQQGPRKDSKRSSPGDREVAEVVKPQQRVTKAARRRQPVQPPPHPPAPAEQNPSPSEDDHIALSRSMTELALPMRDRDPADGNNTGAPYGPENAPSPNRRNLGLSPSFSELFNDDHDDDFINFPDDMDFPLGADPSFHPPMINHDGLNGDIDGLQHPDLLEDMAFFSPTRDDMRPSSSNSDRTFDIWRGPVNYLFNEPRLREDSPEMISYRFNKLTCGILSIMDGEHENPWRNLLWPLARESPALYHAIAAMTSFHSSKDVPSLRVAGHEHKQKSIRFIQEGIRDNSMTDHMAIGTALALGYAESWDQHTATGNTHIKGAQILVKRCLAQHQRNPLKGVELLRLKFLVNAWVYMDVLARLTSFDSDESNDFDNTFIFAIDPPDMVMGDEQPGFGIDFGMPIDARLDPLMGCANTLFPLIGRVANLVRKVCRSLNNSAAIISQAHDLKIALEAWDPPAFIENPEDPTTSVQHALQTAEAYRWATLLHLHQAVPELPSLNSEELAQRVLQYLATVPLSSRTVIVQIYPLMVAGCEAKNEEDRGWVGNRWAGMGQRMRLGVVDKCEVVTEEVWRRKDVYEAQPSARRKLVATAQLQPVRRHGIPLVRTESGFEESDPGSTGMVYSYVEGEAGNGLGNQHEKRPSRPNAHGNNIGQMDVAYTVRGHLHWVGVMWDWGWEILM